MNENTAVALTLKGWFAARILKCKDLDDVVQFWDDLANEVKQTAINNGMPDGIPALIFEGGGAAITVYKQNNE